MSEQGKADDPKMDDAIREALKSVERIERERGADAQAGGAEGGELVDPEAASQETGASETGASETGASETGAAEAGAEQGGVAGKPKSSSGAEAMLEAMIKAKNEMAEVLKQTQKEAKDLYERLARVSADFDNFKKRQTREKQDAIKFANENLVKEIIPVLDNFERALKAADQVDGNAKVFVDGVRMVHKQFEDILGRFGVQGFTTVGQPFDPAKAEAVGGRDDPNVPAQTVLEEFQRGYMLHDRLIRPALVIVATGGPSRSAEGAPVADGAAGDGPGETSSDDEPKAES